MKEVVNLTILLSKCNKIDVKGVTFCEVTEGRYMGQHTLNKLLEHFPQDMTIKIDDSFMYVSFINGNYQFALHSKETVEAFGTEDE